MSGAESVFPLFDVYAGAKLQRLAYLHGFLAENIPGLNGLDGPNGANERLVEAGREDLVITESAAMMSINHPREVQARCNNFSPKFLMWTGSRETGKLGVRDEPETEPIPATEQEVLALRSLPKIGDGYNSREATVATGEYAALSTHYNNHALKPAFTRMLNLFPDFTVSLVTGLSTPEDHRDYKEFEAELFAAYQVMSRLVDQSDPKVLSDDLRDGGVDEWYLCR